MSTITVIVDIDGNLHTRHVVKQPSMSTDQAQSLGDRVSSAAAGELYRQTQKVAPGKTGVYRGQRRAGEVIVDD